MLVKKDLPWNYETVIATVCRTLTLSGSLHGSLTKLMHSLACKMGAVLEPGVLGSNTSLPPNS